MLIFLFNWDSGCLFVCGTTDPENRVCKKHASTLAQNTEECHEFFQELLDESTSVNLKIILLDAKHMAVIPDHSILLSYYLSQYSKSLPVWVQTIPHHVMHKGCAQTMWAVHRIFDLEGEKVLPDLFLEAYPQIIPSLKSPFDSA